MSVPEQVSLPKPRLKTLFGAITRSRWGWGGVAFFVFGLAAAFVIPRPLGALLAILGLVVCAATVAGEIVLAHYTESATARLLPPSQEKNEEVHGEPVQPPSQEEVRGEPAPMSPSISAAVSEFNERLSDALIRQSQERQEAEERREAEERQRRQRRAI